MRRGVLTMVATFAVLLAGASAAPAAQFSSTTAIKMPDGENFLPYPSVIPVSGQRGRVLGVRVTLNQIAHSSVSEVTALLAAPSGASALLFYSRCDGSSSEATPLTLTFEDSAPAILPATGPCASGAYGPGAGLEFGFDVSFPYPAPPAPYQGTLGRLAGGSPNGLWQLFVRDNATFGDGEVRGGWSLDLTLSKTCKKAKSRRAGAAKKKRCKKKKRR